MYSFSTPHYRQSLSQHGWGDENGDFPFLPVDSQSHGEIWLVSENFDEIIDGFSMKFYFGIFMQM